MKTSGSSLLSLLSVFLVISWVNSSNPHEDFLECLRSGNSISGSEGIYTPGNTAYASVLQSSTQNLRPPTESTLKPKVIITPSHESQIQAAIYCAKKHGLQIRTRGGGHDYEGLSYVSEIPFVIVDLRNFTSITIDTENQTAWVGGGATLGEFYYAISEKSRTLAFVAGVCPTVGVGGHISGGGYSMMSRRFGIAADHIIDVKIIDVNGRILDRKSMGEDFFWAIRGGGGASFGVIIAYKVTLVTVPEKVTVFNVTRTQEQNATQLVHRWQYFADKIDENLLIRLFLSSVSSGHNGKRTILVFFTSMFVGGVDDLLEIMEKSFPELGLVKEDCIEMSWVESTVFFDSYPLGEPVDILLSRTPREATQFFKGKSDYVTRPIPENGLKAIWEWLHEEDEGAAVLQFSPYGGRLAEIPESETPFPHRAGNIYMIHYRVDWAESSETSRHVRWTRMIYSYMARYVSKFPRGAYLNYRDLDLGVNKIHGNTSYRQASIWGLRYFKNNFKRLVHVKTEVDPANFFKNEQSVPPLLPQ